MCQCENLLGLRPKCYAFLCTGKVDKNVLQHTRPVEKKTVKGGETLGVSCKQNLIS